MGKIFFCFFFSLFTVFETVSTNIRPHYNNRDLRNRFYSTEFILMKQSQGFFSLFFLFRPLKRIPKSGKNESQRKDDKKKKL